MKHMKRIAIIAALAALPLVVHATEEISPLATRCGGVVPDPIYQDHMVLQRDVPVPVRGSSEPFEVVRLEFKGQKRKAVADKHGRWELFLDPLPADKSPAELVIRGGERSQSEVTLKNVLVGDVWFCSGQSNMGMALYWLNSQKHRPPEQYESQKELRETEGYEHMRLYHNGRNVNPRGFTAAVGGLPYKKWSLYTPDHALGFSMLALYFGREIARSQDIPVGLVLVAMGGAPADVFMSREALEKLPYMKHRLRLADRLAAGGYTDEDRHQWRKEAVAEWEKEAEACRERNERPPIEPGGVNYYNPEIGRVLALPSDVYPAVEKWASFPIKGAIWYQGENDSGDAAWYRDTLAALIRSWRKAWRQRDFPFLIVQLPGFQDEQKGPVENHRWAFLREAQADVAATVPGTGLAVAYDSGEVNDIHPYDKDVPGKRLALVARGMVYDEDLVHRSPTLKSVKLEGKNAVLAFDHVGEGLAAREGALRGFAASASPVENESKTWLWAEARIEGDKVILSAETLPGPITAIRYAWAGNPLGNLVNSADLPAAPFRWKAKELKRKEP